MAKSGFWLRGAKGKLAGTVLYHGKGGTYQREIVTPTNPRTDGQVGQRIKFASTVKFYKSAIANFFKFAYEDKKATESDYNAFMRNNIGKGMMMTREAYLAPEYPSIGNYLLSKGSLDAPTLMSEPSADKIDWKMTSATAPTTAQGIADALAATYGLATGDIITLLHIRSSINDYKDIPGSKPEWFAAQVIVGDTTDERTLAQLSAELGGASVLTVTTALISVNTNDNIAGGAALIFSRKTADGLKVCDGPIVLNDVAETVVSESQTLANNREALDSWGAKGQAVLEGSLVL